MQLYSLIVMLALVALSSASYLIAGHREPNDELIDQIEVHKYRIPFFVRTEDVTFSPNGTHEITLVEAHDIKKKENNVKCSLLSGGPKDTYAIVRLTSDRGHGMHFIVKAYGIRIR